MSLVFINGFDDNMHSFNGVGAAPPTLSFLTTSPRTGTTNLRSSGLTGANSDVGYNWLPLPGGGDATVVVGYALLWATAADGMLLAAFLSDNGSTHHVSVRLNPVTGLLQVFRGPTGTGTVIGSTTLSGTALTTNAWGFWEFKCVLSDTVGEVHVRYNGTAVLDLTGVDTKNAGTKTVIDGVSCPMYLANSGSLPNVDDMYVVTGTGTPNNFLGDCKVQTLYPSGNGDFSQLINDGANSTNNYSRVNEAGAPVTTSYAEGDTVGQRDFYQMGDLSGLAASSTVLGVQVTAWANNPDAGSGRSAILGVRQGTTEQLSTAQALTAATFLPVRGVFTLDPATGAAWTQAGVNSMQAGVQVN